METLNFVLGILSGMILCGLCYVIVDLLRIHKRLNEKQAEITQARETFESLESSIKLSDEKTLQVFRKDMDTIYHKIDQDINSIRREIDNFKKNEYLKEIKQIHDSIDILTRRISDTSKLITTKDEAVRSYIDSRIDKATRGIALVAEGVKNYQESSHEEVIEKVLEKIELKRREENVRRVTEGLPVTGY